MSGNSVQVYKFGTGSLYGVAAGSTVQTPLKFGALQDVSVDFSFTNKELHGQNIFALAVARGEGKVSGKATLAQVNGALYNSMFFGQTLTDSAGANLAVDEAGTVPSTTDYTITVDNSAVFLEDLGVRYATGGNPLIKVSSTPSQGQYSEAAGVYTFAAADEGVDVLISYTYSNTTGQTVKVGNPLQGQAPTFAIYFATTYNSQQVTFKLNACVASKLSMPSKMADWNIDELDFDSFADSSGNVAEIYVPA